MKIFGPDHETLDTDEMISITHNIGNALQVYLTRDHERVFAVYFVPDLGVKVLPVDGEALQKLARESGDTDLLKAAQLSKHIENASVSSARPAR